MGVFASWHTLRQSLDDDSALIVREHKSPLPHSPSALIMNQRTISPCQNCHTSTKYQCTACINNTLTMFVFSKTGHNLVPGLILVGILPSGYNRATTTGQLVEEGKERVVLQATTWLSVKGWRRISFDRDKPQSLLTRVLGNPCYDLVFWDSTQYHTFVCSMI